MIKQYYKSIGVKKRKQDVIAFDVTRDVQKAKFRSKEQYIKTHPDLHPNQTHGMQTQIRKKKK
jgi:hypothetical protein